MIRRLAADTIVYGSSAILSRGLSLIILPIYTRILSPADYGVLDMIVVIGSFATLLIALEINQALARFYGDAQTSEQKRLMSSTTLWFVVSAFAASFVLAFTLAGPLAAWLLDGAERARILRIGLAGIAANGLFYVTQTQMRYALMSTAFAIVSLVYSVTTLGLSVLLGYGLGLGLTGVLWGQFAGAVMATTLGFRLLRGTYGFEFDGALLRSMLAFSMPLVPSALATFFTLYSNRLLLNDILGLKAVGLFGVASRIASAVGLLIIGLQSSLTPLIYAHYKEETTPRHLAQLTEWFIAVALLSCLGVGLYAWEILAVLAQPRYASAAPLVLFLAPATLIGQMYIFFPGISIAKRTHLQLYIFVASALGTFAFNWLLIRVMGITGAGIATLAASVLFISLWIRASQRLYPVPLHWGRVAAATALAATAATAGIWIQNSSLNPAAVIATKGVTILLFGAGVIVCGLITVSDLTEAGRSLRRASLTIRRG